jgi:IS5 family transposase
MPVKIYRIGLVCAHKPLIAFGITRREHRDQLSLEDFFLALGGKLSGDNRWIKLAALIPWDELEDEYAARFCKGFGAPARACPFGRCKSRGPIALIRE